MIPSIFCSVKRILPNKAKNRPHFTMIPVFGRIYSDWRVSSLDLFSGGCARFMDLAQYSGPLSRHQVYLGARSCFARHRRCKHCAILPDCAACLLGNGTPHAAGKNSETVDDRLLSLETVDFALDGSQGLQKSRHGAAIA